MPKALSPQLNRPDQIHALTSLRFFAALYVVFFHEFPGSQKIPSLILHLISLGFISVSFFFLLSGYILAIVYLPRTKLETRSFGVARFARIYPLLFITLLADTPFLLNQRTAIYGIKPAIVKTIGTLIGNMLLLQAWTAKLQYALNEPAWSLSVEAFFYASFPIIGKALWRLHGRSLWYTATAVYVGGQLAVWLLTVPLHMGELKFHPLLHLSTFALGILLARWQRDNNAQMAPAGPPAMLLYATLVLSTAAFFAIVQLGHRVPYTNLQHGLLAPLFAAVIWALSYPQFRVSQWLSQRWLVVLGESSFGLYLLHAVVLHWYVGTSKKMTGEQFAVYLFLCVGLSVLSFYYFETPVRRWLISAFKSRSRETLEAASDA
ncbi:acyltransferase family protein [Granulicella mallensis]|uniref:Acyltransferase 3 n=1 Tax=Granulicella mallensis (strain ATCC BAA-1857 / DSM 23137 / MP5ACTX8) TaxID=682795 RepID=G8P094_GRAMM|nr:acyltransferase [Granulicella mallensis]AEU36888.1 acyltransferase 3 [Granulicella mallensis MP5ACTX8]